MTPSCTPSFHRRFSVTPTNDSSALIRLAASWGTNSFRCTACAGSSAVASACISAPSSPIGNALTRPPDDIVDRVPAAHRVEAGVCDRMDRAVSEHALVQRIGVLDESIVEQVEAEAAVGYAHPSRLIPVGGPRQRCAMKLKTAGPRPPDPSSHTAPTTCDDGENSGHIRLTMRKLGPCLAAT